MRSVIVADLLALVCDVCVFVTFPCGILGQVWYLIVSIPDLCRLSYFFTGHIIFLFVNIISIILPFFNNACSTSVHIQDI